MSLSKGEVWGMASYSLDSSSSKNVSSGSVAARAHIEDWTLFGGERGVSFSWTINYGTATGFSAYVEGGSSGSNSVVINNNHKQTTDNITKTIIFYPNSYSDTYDAKGGLVEGKTSVSRSTDYYNSYNVPSTPTRTGYNFLGWYTEDGKTRIDSSGVIKESASNQKFIAKWEAISYKVRFDGNGATSGSMADQDFRYDAAQNLRVNSFSKTGYIFTGWKFNGVTYSNGQSVNNLTTSHNAVLTFVAQWKVKEFNFNFNINYPNNNTQNTQYKKPYGSSLSFSMGMEEGCYLGNWTYNGGNDVKNIGLNISSDANNVIATIDSIGDLGDDGETFEISVNWILEEYQIEFVDEVDGGKRSFGTFSVLFGQTLELPGEGYESAGNILIRKGYTFVGWKNSKTGAEKLNGAYNVEDLGDYHPDGDMVRVEFVAQWEPIKYYVRFDSNGNTSGSMNQQYFIYDEPQALSENKFTRRGYTFDGWLYDDKIYADKEEVLNLTDTNYQILVFVAQWKANTYTLVLNSNYDDEYYQKYQEFLGERTIEIQCTFDQPFLFPENPFVYVGYIFNDWRKNSDGTGTWFKENYEVSNLTDVNNGRFEVWAIWMETWSSMIEDDYEVVPREESGKVVYEIKNESDIAWLSREMQFQSLTNSKNSGFANCHFIQSGDIDFKGIWVENGSLKVGQWIPIGDEKVPFRGNYDGRGYIIRNLISINTDLTGLFGVIEDANLHNINLRQGESNAYVTAGALAAKGYGSDIYNCTITGITVTGKEHSGIVGYASGVSFDTVYTLSTYDFLTSMESNPTVKRYSQITGEKYVGGLVGYAAEDRRYTSVTITNCYVKNILKGKIVGGMVGYGECEVNISTSGFAGSVNRKEEIMEYTLGMVMGDCEEATKITIQNSFAVARSIGEERQENLAEHMISKEGANISDSLIEATNKTYIYPGNFENWVYTQTGTAILPKAFSWISNSGAVPVTPEMLEAFGFESAAENGLH